MRFLLRFILILLFSWLLQLFLPFWSVAIVAFVVGLLLSQKRKKRLYGRNTPPARAFLAGFLAIFLLWGVRALLLDLGNESLLSLEIFTIIFQSPEALPYPSYVMIALSATIGGLLGGLSAMSGNLLGEAIQG
ncbi:MAG: hypothetical protein NWR72_15500 [Bacteroidia bacterium]|nr:hypothetical protein [Bacteroidia bacterium]